MNIIPMNNTTVQTMSSREIAELTGKLHTHVMRDIRVMLDELGIDQSKFGSVYRDAKGEERSCFNLPKRETMILVSGYSVVLRDFKSMQDGLGIDHLKSEGCHKH